MSPRASCRTQRHSISPPGLPWALPVITVESSAPGPRAAICANLHGDECIGIGVVHALADSLPDTLLRGAVRLYPSLNPEGLRAGARRAPGERTDLNRAFPGNARGSAAERTAHAVWDNIQAFGPQLALDLHADSAASIPYAILDRLITAREPERSRRLERLGQMARATGLTVVHDYPHAPYKRFELDRSLSGALFNHGKIEAFTLELGPRRLLLPEAVNAGVRAVLGALGHMGLVAHAAVAHPSRVTGRWRRDGGPSPRGAGVLRPRHAPGTVLDAGQELAGVYSLDGTLIERLASPTRALILSLAERAWVAHGDSVATIAVPEGSA